MTREDFLEVGTDVFSEYLPKIKASERKQFLEALLDELVVREMLALDDDAEVSDDVSLFDDYDND